MVFKYHSTTPDWLYHRAKLNVDQLPVIQKELLKLFLFTKKDVLVTYTSTFVEIGYQQLMQDTCPTLMQELKHLEIYDRFFVISFISVEATQEFPPHVDVGVNIALNIPLINCEGTYTVWYDGQLKNKGLPDYAIGSEIAKISRVADPRSVKEIDRCDASIPHWINVNILHRPETHHEKLRVAASVRFNPEPLDSAGNLWPHLIS